jgi:ABC-2 type transport system permease protein
MFRIAIIELQKIFRRGRSYIGFIAIGFLVPLIHVALYVDGQNYIDFTTQNLKESFDFEGELMNGYLATYVILNLLWVHIPLLIALIAGDMLAGEAASGTFRLLLTRPVTRLSLMSGKFLAALFYSALIVFWFAVVSLALGVLVMGTGDVIVIKSTIYILSEDDVMWRFLASYGFAVIAMWTVASLAFCFSAFADNSIGPIILTLVVIISFIVISAIDLSIFRAINPFLFVNYMGSWRLYFEEPVNYAKINQSLLVLGGHVVVLFIITWMKFRRKDILT